jgi:hypothetical protein
MQLNSSVVSRTNYGWCAKASSLGIKVGVVVTRFLYNNQLWQFVHTERGAEGDILGWWYKSDIEKFFIMND